nr:hypothetical protein [Lysinibacillus timonensis]
MNNILVDIQEASILLLLLCTFLFYLHLKKVKIERKLSTFEYSMYITTQVAYILWAGSYLLIILSR